MEEAITSSDQLRVIRTALEYLEGENLEERLSIGETLDIDQVYVRLKEYASE